MAPPRFGFFFWPWEPAYTLRMAVLGERLGWDVVGVADTPGNAMDLWVALSLCAERTERVGLAACVTNLVTRHPAVTAAAAASVDALSRGRFTLGIGTGHSAVANVGQRPSAAGAFREGLAFTRALLAGERATLAGVAASPPPKRTRRVPVYAAGSGPAALAAAGAVADGVYVNYGLQRRHVEQARALIADGASKAGRAADALDVWWIACLDVDDRREAAFEKLGNNTHGGSWRRWRSTDRPTARASRPTRRRSSASRVSSSGATPTSSTTSPRASHRWTPPASTVRSSRSAPR